MLRPPATQGPPPPRVWEAGSRLRPQRGAGAQSWSGCSSRSKKDERRPHLVTRVHTLQRHRPKETCLGRGGSRLLPGTAAHGSRGTRCWPSDTDGTSRPVPRRPGPEVAGWCPRGPGDRISKRAGTGVYVGRVGAGLQPRVQGRPPLSATGCHWVRMWTVFVPQFDFFKGSQKPRFLCEIAQFKNISY